MYWKIMAFSGVLLCIVAISIYIINSPMSEAGFAYNSSLFLTGLGTGVTMATVITKIWVGE